MVITKTFTWRGRNWRRKLHEDLWMKRYHQRENSKKLLWVQSQKVRTNETNCIRNKPFSFCKDTVVSEDFQSLPFTKNLPLTVKGHSTQINLNFLNDMTYNSAYYINFYYYFPASFLFSLFKNLFLCFFYQWPYLCLINCFYFDFIQQIPILNDFIRIFCLLWSIKK